MKKGIKVKVAGENENGRIFKITMSEPQFVQLSDLLENIAGLSGAALNQHQVTLNYALTQLVTKAPNTPDKVLSTLEFVNETILVFGQNMDFANLLSDKITKAEKRENMR